MIATHLDVSKLINYISDRLLVEIQMGYVVRCTCKTIERNECLYDEGEKKILMM